MFSKLVTYQGTPPLTFDKRIKRIEMLPTGTYNQSLNQQDIVRFYFKSAKDLIDPWSMQVQIEITIPDQGLDDDTKFKHKCLQLDGSASSLIQNMVIYDPQGREIERINQYSRLAAFLGEMKYNPQEKGGHDHQGFGGLNLGQFGSIVTGPQPTNTNMFYDNAISTTTYLDPSNTANLIYNPNMWNGALTSGWSQDYLPSTIYKNNLTNAPLLGGFDNASYTDQLLNLSLPTGGQVILEESYLKGPLGIEFDIAGQFRQCFSVLNANNSDYDLPYVIWGDISSNVQSYQPWVSGTSTGPGSNSYMNGSISQAYIHLWAQYSLVQYWSPIKSCGLQWECSPFFSWDGKISAGPLGTHNGAPPCTIAMADAYFGSGFIAGCTGKQVKYDGNCQNNLNQALAYETSKIKNSSDLPPGILGSNGTQFPKSLSLINGFNESYPCNLASNCFEPKFSKTVKQRVIKNGAPSVEAVTSWTFQIPLMSGFLGSLITAERYKLIPMAVLNDVVVEFYFNPYAFFTSYWSTNVGNRGYLIKDVRLTMETMVIEDKAISDPIFGQLNNFTFPTQSFYLGPQYSISGNNLPPEIQYNMGFKSMRAIFFGFYRALYSKVTAARYNYRLSGNLTSFYIQYGTENYPSLPISGNAGNNYGPLNNYEFYFELLKALDCVHSECQRGINVHNFAINYSEIEPANYDPEGDIQLQTFNKALIEGPDQLCYFYENRVKGACMYGLDCQTMNYDQNAFSGIDTSINKPFSLFMEYNNENPYPGNTEFVTWINYDMIISKTEDGFSVWGRT